MSIDVKDIRETVSESEETLADATTGAVVSAVEAATDPVTTVRKTVRRLEKRGEPVNRRIERRVERTANRALGTASDVVTLKLAERLTLRGIRMAKDRARRRDTVGDVLFRGFEILHRGLDSYMHEVGKFQDATEPPARNGERAASPARRSATARARRSASRSRRTTRRSGSKKTS